MMVGLGWRWLSKGRSRLGVGKHLLDTSIREKSIHSHSNLALCFGNNYFANFYSR